MMGLCHIRSVNPGRCMQCSAAAEACVLKRDPQLVVLSRGEQHLGAGESMVPSLQGKHFGVHGAYAWPGVVPQAE